MIEYNRDDVIKALTVLDSLNDNCRWEQICKLNTVQMTKYAHLLNVFENINGIDDKSKNVPKDLYNQKGRALENLVRYLFEISGGIFKVDCNLRTSTNEIDDLVTLTQKGKTLLSARLIDSHLNCFLGECKNYAGAVSVTYVGKLCSLMLTNGTKLGILFSYNGITGSGWSHGAGLVKKFYLHREKIEDRYCIVDFSINEFKSILEGKNLLQIIDEQLKALQMDTDYSKYISRHPAETE